MPQQVAAQAPEKMSYQAIVRNAGNNLVTNQSIGMQIRIQQSKGKRPLHLLSKKTLITLRLYLRNINPKNGCLKVKVVDNIPIAAFTVFLREL